MRGGLGGGAGQFSAPRGLDIDGLGRLYVADSSNHRIQVFDSLGTFITQVGGFGVGPGQFNAPRGVAIGSRGALYVTDTDNNRVQKFICP